MAKTIKARVLSALALGSIMLKPNDLLQADEKLIKRLEKAGQVDASSAAVKYCEGGGAKPVIYDAQPEPVTEAEKLAAENKAALEAELADLTAKLEVAAAEEKPAIEGRLTEIEAELAAFNA